MSLYKLITGLVAMIFFIQASAQQTKKDSVKVTHSNTSAITTNNKISTKIISNPTHDINKRFDSLERSVEIQYSKLIKEVKDNKSELAGRITQIDKQITDLKNKAKQIDQFLATARLTQLQSKAYQDSLKKISNEIEIKKEKKISYKSEINSLDKQIAALADEKQKTLADLRKQRRIALAQAAKNKQ